MEHATFFIGDKQPVKNRIETTNSVNTSVINTPVINTNSTNHKEIIVSKKPIKKTENIYYL